MYRLPFGFVELTGPGIIHTVENDPLKKPLSAVLPFYKIVREVGLCNVLKQRHLIVLSRLNTIKPLSLQ